MAKYHYFRLFADNSGIYFRSPDEKIAEWAIQEIKNLVPTCKLEKVIGESYRIHKLDGRDSELGNWLFQRLLDDEWEPFATSDYNMFNTTDAHLPARRNGMEIIHFRKKE